MWATPLLAQLVAWTTFGAEPARAGPLTWEAPTGCPTVEEVLVSAGFGDGRPLGLEVTGVVFHPDQHRWVLHLHVRTGTGELDRRIEGRDCRELAETTGFVLAMHSVGARRDEVRQAILDGRPPTQRPRVAQELPEAPSPSRDHPLDPAVTADTTSVDPVYAVPELRDVYVVDDPKRPSSLRFGAFTYTGVGYGALPTVDVALGLGLALLGPKFRVQLSGARWLERSEDLPESGSVSVSMWGGRLAGGPSFSFGRVEVPVLAAAEAGAMAAQGYGLEQTRRQTVGWAAVGLAPGVSIRLHRVLHLWAEAYGFAALYRPRFYVLGVGGVHHAAPGGGRFALGLELRLPAR